MRLTITFLLVFILLASSLRIFAVCTGGNNAGSIEPQAHWQTMNVNTYTYYTFLASFENEVFVFSFCQGGGSNSIDTQLEVHDNDGNSTGFYSNDHCGVGSEIVFSAPAAGTYRISIYEFNCQTNTTAAGTLAYKSMPTPTSADCLGALPLCNVFNSHEIAAYDEGHYYDLYDFRQPGNFGQGWPDDYNNCPNCMLDGELNSMWYVFSVQSAGNLAFTITHPSNEIYDWSLHSLNNGVTCYDLVDYQNHPPVSCNWYGCVGTGTQTGMQATGGGNCQHWPGQCSGNAFNAPIWVNAGEVYALHISSYIGGPGGYDIDFSNSTAQIVNDTPPVLEQILYDPYCGSSSITVQMSESIWCVGVDTDAFTLTGPLGEYNISDVWSALCVAGEQTTYDGTFYDDVWTIELSDYLTQSGEYTLTLNSGGVEDVCDNPSVESSIVFYIDGITADVSINSLAGCPGESIGEIEVTNVTGGTPPYYYEWNGPDSFFSDQSLISGLSPGTYLLRVTDDEGICEYLEEVELFEVPPINLTIVGDTIYCEGDHILIEVSSDIDPLASYDWVGPGGWTSTGSDINRPNATPDMEGEYTLIVTDTYGCTNSFTGNIYVIENIPIVASSDGPYCEEEDINLSATTIAGAIYSWTGPNDFTSNEQNPTITNANTSHSGIYTVTAGYEDCSSTNSVTVVVNPKLEFSLNPTDPLCYQEPTGEIMVNVTSGTPSYFFSWSNNTSVNPATGLIGGEEVCVTVTDAAGCEAYDCHTLNNPPELTVETITEETECGETEGEIWANATGGTGSHTFMWSTGQLGDHITNLPPGEICVTVTDAHNCVIEVCDEIPAFGDNEVFIEQLQEIYCYGNNQAVLSADMPEGFLPLTYQWSVSGETSSTISDIGAGEYSVTVTDIYGCTGESSHTVTQPEDLDISLNSEDVLCHAGSDGSATIQVTGGIPQYQYVWSNGSTGSHIANLTAGTYGITVTDANDCTKSDYVVINQPDNPVGFNLITNNVSCYNRFDGYAIALGTGGTPPYQVFWYQFGQLLATGEEVSTLSAGSYLVRVEDENNCSASSEFTIIEPTELIVESSVQSVSCKGHDDGRIVIAIDGGTAPYEISWNTNDTTLVLESIRGGQYYVTVTDANFCERNVGIYVPESGQLCLNIPDAFTPNGDGINDTWEIGYMEKYPDAIINVFNRWGQHIFQTRGNSGIFWDGKWEGKFVPAGSYVYVIDLRNGMEPFTGVVTVIY